MAIKLKLYVLVWVCVCIGRRYCLEPNPVKLTPEDRKTTHAIEKAEHQNGSEPMTCLAHDEEKVIDRRVIEANAKWTEFKVYLQASYSDKQQTLINNAMYRLQQVIPCVSFSLYPRGIPPSGDYVSVQKRVGCNSAIGRRGGPQTMSLVNGCMSVGQIMHQMMHALGCSHEHTRPDRDDHITVHLENAVKGTEPHFQKRKQSELLSVPYDVNSIMHYTGHAFSEHGQPTIVAKNGANVGDFGDLTPFDVTKIQKMYSCK